MITDRVCDYPHGGDCLPHSFPPAVRQIPLWQVPKTSSLIKPSGMVLAIFILMLFLAAGGLSAAAQAGHHAIKLAPAIRPEPEDQTIFQIGKRDQSYAEFARVRSSTHPVVYRVGKSSPSNDWHAYQPGSFDDFEKALQGVPFTVEFSLTSNPKGKFILHLDAILRQGRPAAPRYAVDVDGHSGSFHLRPGPAPELWWSTGGGAPEYMGYVSSDMPLRASYFRRGPNTLTVRCLDGYGIYYDDLSLINDRQGRTPLVTNISVHPTIFYKKAASGLVELVNVGVQTSAPVGHADLKIVVGRTGIKREIAQTSFGDINTTIEVPASTTSVPISVYFGRVKDSVFHGVFEPSRRWRVYAMPMEQADFGFDEVPARTLEWENRYIDRALKIEKAFPSYSFTLDAAANLQSYLADRDQAHREQLLRYLRDGKFGINAFYLHFFSGLASPEEIFQLLSYSIDAGKNYGFPIDSANQTDEPTVSWALPEILAASGIKYFAEGSDPIRAPFNPIGHLNFRSPFYWKAPDGSKVLVWSAVSYRVLDQMTWDGWNPEDARSGKYTASLFGLKHSLPLFLSQYNRKDYPFDAVFLYGLHNDEVPILRNGSADIIQRWNKEFAYPKIIPATEHAYFTYVIRHFASRIPTYRGDGGAYWEDEAGADARVAAMNRASQTQITAAEKLDSIAGWMEPLLRDESTAFREAWHNLELADDYVWSDAAAASRPYSYRTGYEEGIHRWYAKSAWWESRDLLTVAMDRLSELIRTDRSGVVVFNAASHPHSGFFTFELEPNEAFQDPSSGQELPCGSLKSLDSYEVVRCWAKDVPPLGYRFYPIVRGTTPTGRKIQLTGPDATIEGRFYRLQIDEKTGAVSHLIDKQTGQDLVNGRSGYDLNEYLYVTGGDPSRAGTPDDRLLQADPTLPVPQLTIHTPLMIGSPAAERFPWGITITTHAQAPNTPEITSTITLNDEQKVIGVDDRVEKTETLKKEGVYFAFPFAIADPTIEYRGATAWVNPEADMLPGANRQWFATQGGVWIHGFRTSVAWATRDAPLVTLEDINRGLWPESIRMRNGSVFSYAMNNYWYTDTPAQQGGKFRFRYALTSGAAVSAAGTALLAQAVRSPLYPIRHYHKEWKQVLPSPEAGFIQVSPSGVDVLTIRPITERGYLIRIQNTTSKAVDADLQFPLVELEEAYAASAVGGRAGSATWSAHAVRLPIRRYGIKTLVVTVEPKGK